MIKRLVFVFTVFLTTIFSSVSFADWTWVSKNVNGTTYMWIMRESKNTVGMFIIGS